MDILEKFHSKFGRWYEQLFNDSGSQALRPKDVLRTIIDAMEEHRSEGFDGKVYVPNKYVLELAVSDEDERAYLYSFLDEEELAAVLKRYMAQNGYSTRGPLDFTLVDVDGAETTEKLKVKVRFEKGAAEAEPVAEPRSVPIPEDAPAAPVTSTALTEEDDLLTVAAPRAAYDEDEMLTIAAVPVAWAALVVITPDGHRSLATISKPEFSIGRSKQAGNDLTLSGDGQVSKRHARIERESDGQATIYDLGSTNGVLVNGKLIPGNITLRDGDEVLIGATKVIFQRDDAAESVADEGSASAPSQALRRARLVTESTGKAYPLASETLIGKAITADIVLDDEESSTRQAQIIAPDALNYYLQDLAARQTTRVNGRTIYGEERIRLQDGDRVEFGRSSFVFQPAEGA
ncbi:MAG TPA: FhaA domain-containing protein [Capsulimonadaceae bacterium]|jgi:pSer/pThr/pTyr-binding forkhead associated (FHA) protein